MPPDEEGLLREWCVVGGPLSKDAWGTARVTIRFSLAPYRGHSGPSGPKSQKSRQKVPGAFRPRGQKRLKKVGKRLKKSKQGCFWLVVDLFFDFFWTSFDPGAERPREPFFDFFWGLRARRARMTPVRGQGDCNSRRALSIFWGEF